MAQRDLDTPAVDLREDDGVWWIIRNVLRAVRTAPFPTIAAINGHCLGTGLGLALASDIRIAEVWQNMTLSEGIDKSVEVFSSVFASAETYEQIERPTSSRYSKGRP